MLHMLAETYGKLPSQVLREADTFDMMVFDVISTVRDYHNKKDNNQHDELNKMYDTDVLRDSAQAFIQGRNKQ